MWTTCVFFFQTTLLAGYAYAHVLTRYFKPRPQVLIHTIVLAGSLASLPIVPSDAWKPQTPDHPVVGILALLGATVGVPFLALASTSPLLQQWFGSTRREPYGLYVLSNIGSLLALLTYPTFFEAHFRRQTQALMWECGLVLYCCCSGFCAVRWFKTARGNFQMEARPANPIPGACSEGVPSIQARVLWVLWPACASILLLAVTNKLCLDVAVVPLLWVLPLVVYLLSFILCFSGGAWYPRRLFMVLTPPAFACLCWALFHGAGRPFWEQVCLYVSALFVCCMVCHGELYRIRPAPQRLTEFYLLSATGGALGGLFVSILAPLLFKHYYELHWSLALLGLLFVFVHSSAVIRSLIEMRGRSSRTGRGNFISNPQVLSLGLCVLWIGFLGLVTTLWLQARRPSPEIVYRSRNFYGVLTVFEHRKEEPKGHHVLLQHGRITHGFQFVDPQLRELATTYYGPQSGLGLAVNSLPPAPRRIGVVGLGTGTLAAYARQGDEVRFYEINPEIIRLARSRFNFLSNSAGNCVIQAGDARLSLEKESSQQFDLLVLDAFSSDSIPVHLLTREAFSIYLRHLAPQGILAVHISNHFLRLDPVVTGLARYFELHTAFIDHDAKPEQWWTYSSTWMLLSRDPSRLESPSILRAASPAPPFVKAMPLWTDDYSSLFRILR